MVTITIPCQRNSVLQHLVFRDVRRPYGDTMTRLADGQQAAGAGLCIGQQFTVGPTPAGTPIRNAFNERGTIRAERDCTTVANRPPSGRRSADPGDQSRRPRQRRLSLRLPVPDRLTQRQKRGETSAVVTSSLMSSYVISTRWRDVHRARLVIDEV